MYINKIAKKVVLILMALFISAICISSCSTADKTLTEENNGDILKLKTDDVIEIKLESNPTTGYSWFVGDGLDETIVSVSDPEFIEFKEDEELVGAGGYEIFSLKAISEGRIELILNYKRPWEEGEEPIDTFELTISVE